MIHPPVTATAKLVPVPAVGKLIKEAAVAAGVGGTHRQIQVSAALLKCVCTGHWGPQLYFSFLNCPVLHEDFTYSALWGRGCLCTELKAANPLPSQHASGILCGAPHCATSSVPLFCTSANSKGPCRCFIRPMRPQRQRRLAKAKSGSDQYVK